MTRELLKSASWNYLSRVIDFALPTFIFLACAKLLTIRETAELSMFLAAAAILNVVFGFGQDAFILRFGSELTPAEIRARFRQRLFISTISGVALCAILLLVSSTSSWIPEEISIETLGLGLSYVVALSAVGFTSHLLLARATPKSTIAPAIIGRMTQVIVLVLFIAVGSLTFLEAALSYVLATLIQALLLIRGTDFAKERQITTLRLALPNYAKHMWFADVANLLLGRQIDVIMLSVLVMSALSIATYNLGSQLISSIEAGLSFGILSTFIPHFSALTTAEELRSEHQKAFSFYSKWASPIIGLSIVVLPAIVSTIYKTKYPELESILIAGLLLLLIRVGGFGGNLSYTVLLSKNLSRESTAIRVTCAICGVILNVVLIWQYGALGAILGSQFTAVVVCACETALARREKLILPIIASMRNVISVLVLTFIAHYLSTAASIPMLIVISMSFLIVYYLLERVGSSLQRS